MKKFFSKIWEAIKAPVCYLAIAIIAVLYLIGIIDGIIRCFDGIVVKGIIQVVLIFTGLPLGGITVQALLSDARSGKEIKN